MVISGHNDHRNNHFPDFYSKYDIEPVLVGLKHDLLPAKVQMGHRALPVHPLPTHTKYRYGVLT